MGGIYEGYPFPKKDKEPKDTDNYGCFFSILFIAIIFIGCIIYNSF